MLKVGMTVKFRQENPDEIGTRYTIIWIDGNHAQIEFICDWTIRPSQVVCLSEIEQA